MKGWEPFLKDWINLITWMCLFGALVWKGLSTLEKIAKEKSVGASKVDEIEKRLTEIDKDKAKTESRFTEHDAEIISLKSIVKEMGNRMWDFLKNKHE